MPTQPSESLLKAGILGLLIGDALGVPYEFHPPEHLPSEIKFEPPTDFLRAHAGVPPGSWSDDGAMALCLAASLAHCGRLDVVDLGNRFVNWWHHGYLAANGNVFDIGLCTTLSLRRISRGHPPESSGQSSEQHNGNGSLMRVLPLALWHSGSDAELVLDAHRQSILTHAHPRSQVCCALYCLWTRYTLDGTEQAFDRAVETLHDVYSNDRIRLTELTQQILPFSNARGTGYVVDTLHSAKQALKGASAFEEAVIAAIRFGNDTDTTACVVGGLAGIRWGLESIPTHWLNALVDEKTYKPVLSDFIQSVAKKWS